MRLLRSRVFLHVLSPLIEVKVQQRIPLVDGVSIYLKFERVGQTQSTKLLSSIKKLPNYNGLQIEVNTNQYKC